MDEELKNTIYFVDYQDEPVMFDELKKEIQEALMKAWR